MLRHQIHVLRRQVSRPHLKPHDGAVLAAASRLLPRKRWLSLLVPPETIMSPCPRMEQSRNLLWRWEPPVAQDVDECCSSVFGEKTNHMLEQLREQRERDFGPHRPRRCDKDFDVLVTIAA